MNLELIIDELKARCPTFEQRVAGAAEYEGLRNVSNLRVPAAYVIPLDESSAGNNLQNSIRQTLTEGFMVVVVLNNTADLRGQTATQQLHLLRKEIWKAILGWQPDDDYEMITYDGGSLLGMDRARLDYGFEFSTEFTIDESDSRIADDVAALPAFESMLINIDHKTLPPDGQVDHVVEIDLPQ